jgi:glycosyltransferase involved in cell wall biosynthesis
MPYDVADEPGAGASRSDVPVDDARRSRVAMIVGNAVSNDNRVLKSATTLARAGLDVTIVGLAPDGVRTETMLGDVRILRVPVENRLRDARRRNRARRRQRRVVVAGWADSEGSSTAQVELLAREREAVDSSLARRTLGPRRFLVRARSKAQRELDRVVSTAWKANDRMWSRTGAFVNWRTVTPELRDYELAFGPVVDLLEPDVIHAHDFHMVNVASLAARRAALQGRRVPWIYDAHEFVPGMATYGGKTPRVIAAYAGAEAEYARDAAAVITVSPYIADELQRRHRLTETPTVVYNAPAASSSPLSGPDIRSAVGLADDVPLAVYSGGVTPARGIDVVVRALPDVPGVHLAVVAVPSTKGRVVEALVAEADRLGVRDRVHLLDPVAPDEVTAFLRTADVGVHPLPGGIPNHDMALPNKLFEYLQAGLPLVVSDAKALAQFVTSNGVGGSFRTGDAADLAATLRGVLADRERYVDAVRSQRDRDIASWQGQEPALLGVYSRLLGRDLEVPSTPFVVEPEQVRARPDGGPVVGFGPANSAGQAWAWAKALERAVPGLRAEVVAVTNGRLDFPCDVGVDKQTFHHDATWQLAFHEHVLAEWTHALLEAGRPVAGTLNGRTFAGDAEVLSRAGLRVGLVFHGSEIRDPRRHAAAHRWSPFRDASDELTARLQRKYDDLAPVVAAFDGPTFVSTPDLLDYVPGAVWLPLVVDLDAFAAGELPLQRNVPVVMHAPSNTALKGTAEIEAALAPLVAEGLVDYRRIEGVSPDRFGALLAESDIVVDQLLLGSYGVLACEAMALGRVVVGNVDAAVRSRVGVDVPVLDATPDTLIDVLRGVLADRESSRATALAGRGFVEQHHDGTAAARVLRDHFLA